MVRDSPTPIDLSYALDEEHPGLLRRYAIPGSQRCIGVSHG